MPCKVAIIGACTLVGRELVKTLSDRSFPLSHIRLFDTEHGVGQKLLYDNKEVLVEEISEHILREERFRFIFFAEGSNISEQYIPIAAESEAFIIDMSPHSKHNMEIPLLIPEINAGTMGNHKIFATPLCLTTQLCLALNPIHQLSPITRLVMSTYQAVSGAGFFGVEELEKQIIDIEDGKEARVHYLPKQIAFNVYPQVDRFGADDLWTKEERSIISETKRILSADKIDMAVTCVRVPVIRGHSASIMIEISGDLPVEDLIQAWKAEDISVYDNDYPTPWELEGTVDIGIGRLRKDMSRPNCYHFWCVADNLARGTALNSVQIAEELL
jgi:aspartate-semialdehyde dehydrogenase